MFGVRLAIQLPLWLTGQAALLGLVNIPLGLPLYVGVLWITWRLVRTSASDPSEPLA
jgi:hypothetical protein